MTATRTPPRGTWWYWLAGVAVVAAAMYVAFRPRLAAIALANAGRVKVGMTRAEVESVLGPPRDESGRPWSGPVVEDEDVDLYHAVDLLEWVTDDFRIYVSLGRDGRVIAVAHTKPEPNP